MKIGTFYLLSKDNNLKNNSFNYMERLIVTLTTAQWRSGKTILIICENKPAAQKIDELLWTCDKNTFLPHNLYTNNICYNIPIIILWEKYNYKNISSKNILMNLTQKSMNFFFHFNEIIDFVPVSENLKKLARNRYQLYKKIGFQLRTIKHPLIL